MAARVDTEEQRVSGSAALELTAAGVGSTRHGLRGAAILRRPDVGFRQRAVTGIIACVKGVLRATNDHYGHIPGTSIVPKHRRRRRNGAQNIAAEAPKGVGHDAPRAHSNREYAIHVDAVIARHLGHQGVEEGYIRAGLIVIPTVRVVRVRIDEDCVMVRLDAFEVH